MIGTHEEYNRIRGILLTLEPSELADALMELTHDSRAVYMKVIALASTETRKITLFKEYIHAITHQTRRSTLTGRNILLNLKRSLELLSPDNIDPKIGLQLMESFYETDSFAFESTTELDFEFEMVFTDEGFEIFAEIARRCTDTTFVVELVKKLYAEDNYGVRGKLHEEASTYLSEAGLKLLNT